MNFEKIYETLYGYHNIDPHITAPDLDPNMYADLEDADYAEKALRGYLGSDAFERAFDYIKEHDEKLYYELILQEWHDRGEPNA
jgi:hypothetical protein